MTWVEWLEIMACAAYLVAMFVTFRALGADWSDP